MVIGVWLLSLFWTHSKAPSYHPVLRILSLQQLFLESLLDELSSFELEEG